MAQWLGDGRSPNQPRTSVGVHGVSGRDINISARDHAFIQFTVQTKLPSSDLPTYVCTISDARYRLSMFQGVDWRELYDLHTEPVTV